LAQSRLLDLDGENSHVTLRASTEDPVNLWFLVNRHQVRDAERQLILDLLR